MPTLALLHFLIPWTWVQNLNVKLLGSKVLRLSNRIFGFWSFVGLGL